MEIPVVNDKDEIVGYKERSLITSEDIIRVTSIWTTDGKDNILLQKRSMSKKNSPGLWCPSVSGTVEKGEEYEANAYKELSEEIGIHNVVLIKGKKYEYNTQKFNQLFFLQIPTDTKFELEKDTIDQIKWFTKDELINLYKKSPELFVKFIGVVLEDLYMIK